MEFESTNSRRKQIISDVVFAFVMGVMLAALVTFWPLLTAVPK